ncbi:hypothetical protein QFZ51_004936 [Chitinophaga sp. W3I9]
MIHIQRITQLRYKQIFYPKNGILTVARGSNTRLNRPLQSHYRSSQPVT